MKRNLKIVLIIFVLMCLLGLYEKVTYIPIENPTNDVELRVEGIKTFVWFAFALIFNVGLFLLLTVITYVIKLIKHVRKP